MQRSGLLESARFGKWTYYRRNEANIQALAEFIKTEL
jgi:ArsR family transcriptional regulator